MRVITNINDSANLPAIIESLRNASVKLTFWGSRVVKLNGSQEHIPLTYIRDISTAAMLNFLKTQELTALNPTNGREIIEKLWSLYVNSQEQVKTANCCTKFFVYIRACFLHVFPKVFYPQNIIKLSCAFKEPSSPDKREERLLDTALKLIKLLSVV